MSSDFVQKRTAENIMKDKLRNRFFKISASTGLWQIWASREDKEIAKWLGRPLITRWTLARALLVIVTALLLLWSSYLHFFKGLTWADWTGFEKKTFWDWMELFVVPLALAVIAVWFNKQENMTEREIATDRQQDSLLQSYLDKMTDLLLQKRLSQSMLDDEVRDVARARTLGTLRELDPFRKGSVLLFLYEAGLISVDKTIVNLRKADLSKAILKETDLSNVNLREADLSYADFSESNLSEANLCDTTLYKTALFDANLSNANLRKAILVRAFLSDTYLNKADLREASLDKADLRMANLEEANLEGSTLRFANLRGANLAGANLDFADLSMADLREANLEGCSFRKARLIGAKVSQQQLASATTLEGALLPKDK